MAVNLYTSRVVLSTLGVQDYGIYNVVGGVIVMLQFLTTSLSGASSRFITFALGKEDLNDQKQTFGNILSIHGLLAIIVLILGETLGLWFVSTQLQIPEDRSLAAFWVYQCSVISFIVALIYVPHNASIIAHEKMSIFAYISILDAGLRLLAIYLLGIFSCDKLILYSILILCVQIIIMMIYMVYSFRNFEETHVGFRFSPKIFKEIFNFSLWTMNGNLAVVGYTQGLNILLNIFFNPAINAARAIAVQVQAACQQFATNFQMATRPQIIISYAQSDLTRMHTLIVSSSKFSFFLMLFLVVPLILEAEFVLSVWLKDVPEYTTSFLRWVLIIGLLNSLSYPIGVSVHATGDIKKYQIIEGTILLSILPIAYLLLKFFNVNPASVFIVHLVMELCAQVARVIIVLPKIQMKIKTYLMQVIKPVVIVAALSPIVPLILHETFPQGYIPFFSICLISVLCNALTMYVFGCNDGEKSIVRDKLRNIISKK